MESRWKNALISSMLKVAKASHGVSEKLILVLLTEIKKIADAKYFQLYLV